MVRKLLQVRVRLFFPEPEVLATPKGAFAGVGQTDKDLLEQASVLAMPCVVAPDGDRDSMPVVVKEALAMEVPVRETSSLAPAGPVPARRRPTAEPPRCRRAVRGGCGRPCRPRGRPAGPAAALRER